jgi:hypothetical protein
MVNLTSFKLGHNSPGEVSVRQLLDFFESAPRLCNVQLHSVIPTAGTQNGQLVSLACLKKMYITGDVSSSLLLDYLLIPVGAKLTKWVESLRSPIEDHLPKSLDNLRNLPNFTTIHLDDWFPLTRISGPNGQVNMVSRITGDNTTYSVLESLAQFDTSTAERLKIDYSHYTSGGLPYRVLLSMINLRTLTLFLCGNTHIFVNTLHPSMSSSEVVVCPKLEELILGLRTYGGVADIKPVTGMAAARALRGARLKSVRIASSDKFVQIDVLELKKHVLHVECGREVDGAIDDGGDGDDEGWWKRGRYFMMRPRVSRFAFVSWCVVGSQFSTSDL